MSSSEEVNDISGRGVGMDSVREIVDALHGKISVSSRPGIHTTFTIQIPLTLAIMDFLKVTVGDSDYYLHLDYVVESLDQTMSRQNSLGVLEWRGRFLPLIDFRTVFSIGGKPPDASQIIVLSVRDEHLALQVDKVIGLRQGLFKGLGRFMGRIEGILGAAMTETGDLALIIDAAALPRMVDHPVTGAMAACKR